MILPRNGEVHIWTADLDQTLGLDESLLASDEVNRANAYHRALHRQRYLAGRIALRRILADYLLANPSSLNFEYGTYGKPRLSGTHSDNVHFNVSHCENALLIGFSTTAPVGVDIETSRSFPDEPDLVRNFFESSEQSEYFALPDHLKNQGFLNAWTRKESFLKARGDGLQTPLDAFSVTLDPREKCQIRQITALPEKLENWSLIPLDIDPKMTAALATKSEVAALQVHRYSPAEFATYLQR